MDKTAETVSLRAFARIIGNDPAYVARLKQAGRLVMVGKLVDVAASKTRIAETESGARSAVAVREHWEKQRADPQKTKKGEGADENNNLTRAYWDRRTAAATAQQREIELAKMRGELIPREDVDFVLKDFGAVWRGLLENLPDRLAPQVFPLKTLEETHAAIVEAAEDLQREMAETMKRRSEGLS